MSYTSTSSEVNDISFTAAPYRHHHFVGPSGPARAAWPLNFAVLDVSEGRVLVVWRRCPRGHDIQHLDATRSPSSSRTPSCSPTASRDNIRLGHVRHRDMDSVIVAAKAASNTISSWSFPDGYTHASANAAYSSSA
ncbi:hypothetical protein DSL92_04440 [Billgrantia gudaonensis]|uniref:Uncharacterized protein n=1 Tax=Billgrantia gudaonensis TaxID=376427 RepID=A0A432JJG4_9GAMM|nr:hypothetical protein DSL92_04440 [Halomonas gudaonensis]